MQMPATWSARFIEIGRQPFAANMAIAWIATRHRYTERNKTAGIAFDSAISVIRDLAIRQSSSVPALALISFKKLMSRDYIAIGLFGFFGGPFDKACAKDDFTFGFWQGLAHLGA